MKAKENENNESAKIWRNENIESEIIMAYQYQNNNDNNNNSSNM
jgi:hypothetical protein